MSNPLEDEYFDFHWQGTDSHDTLHEGIISARNLLLARVALIDKGYQITAISVKVKPVFQFNFQHISSAEITIFFRQLATLLSAGIPLVQALSVIGQGHENQGMQKLLSALMEDIQNGQTLADSLRKFPKYFEHLICNLITAGENAGILESLLTKIATYKEKTELLRKKFKKALIYPLTVLSVAFVVTAILLVFVIPVFKELYTSFGAELPLFTQSVLSLSTWLINDWWIIGLLLLIISYSFYYAQRHSKAFEHFIDSTLLKLPIVGQLITKAIIARFTRTLSTLSAAGIPIVDALHSVSGVCGNYVYSEAILSMRDDVATGHRLQYAMLKTHLFPNFVQQMIAIGEESGALDNMLAKTADFYEAELDNLVDNLGSLVEPLIMVLLGLIIGGLVIAMYLPIFQMGAVMA